jgi:hypothetical protein
MPAPLEKTAGAGDHVVAPAKERKTKMILHTLGFVVLGGAAGFAYHKLVGCASGACPITANPVISTLYGALIGFVASGGLGR